MAPPSSPSSPIHCRCLDFWGLIRKFSAWHLSRMCYPADSKHPCLSPVEVPNHRAPRARVSPPHPHRQATGEGGLPAQPPRGRCLRSEQGARCAPAGTDPDILTAALCVSEAQFLSKEEKQASPLPRGGETDGPGQAAGRGKASACRAPGGGGHPNTVGTRPPSSEAGAGEAQGQRPSEWRKHPREALRWGKEPQNKVRIPSRPPGHAGTCPHLPLQPRRPPVPPHSRPVSHTSSSACSVISPEPTRPTPTRPVLPRVPPGHAPGSLYSEPCRMAARFMPAMPAPDRGPDKGRVPSDNRLSGSYACKDPALLPPSLPSAFP